MDFTQVALALKKDKLAARRYEKSGHGKFRDCVTVCRNGKLFFDRYCYGEAASLTFTLSAKEVQDDGTVLWNYDACDYSAKDEAPKQLTGFENGELFFDGKEVPWKNEADYKTFKRGGLGRIGILFAK